MQMENQQRIIQQRVERQGGRMEATMRGRNGFLLKVSNHGADDQQQLQAPIRWACALWLDEAA